MRKLSIIFVLSIILGTIFTSCTNEGGNGPVDMSLIKGKWNFDKSTATSSGFTIPYTTPYFKNEDGCTKDYVDVLSGGIVKYGDYSSNCVFSGKDGTWTQNENTVTIDVTGTSFSGTFRVTSLTATELVLKIDGTYSGQSGTLSLYFTK